MEDSVGETIVFDRPDKKTCPGYLAVPERASHPPGFVVLQEWWGLNDQIKDTADRFAGAGYRVLAPDLYRGRIAKNPEQASQMISGLNFLDVADEDIRGAIQFLKQFCPRAAVGGFCVGGALALLAAVRVPEVNAAVCFYGIPPLEPAEFKKISVPVICHFANLDERYPPVKVNELEVALKQSKSEFELYRYDAHHGFMNEERPKTYDPGSAKLAWDRTLAFLRNNIG
jgi:carboxymethylenebutenolidase